MIKELTLPLEALEVVNPLEVVAGQIYVTGWYVDRTTGQYYYYDAISGQWYYYAAGYIYPLALIGGWNYRPWTGAYLGTMNVGDTIRVTATFNYVGPQRSRNIRISLFHYAKGTTPKDGDNMNELAGSNVTVGLTFGPFITPQLVLTQRDIVIGSEASQPEGRDLGAYAKFTDVLTGFVYEENCTYGFYGIATVPPSVGVFSEFKISGVTKV